MLGMIVSKVKGIMLEAIERYAKKQKVAPTEIQIRLGLKQMLDKDNKQIVEEGIRQYQVKYSYDHNYKNKEETTIEDIIDSYMLQNMGEMATQFIAKSLVGWCSEHQILADNIKVIIIHNGLRKKEKNVILWLYNADEPVKEITLKDIFSEDKAMSM